MIDVLTCRLCGRHDGPLGWKKHEGVAGVVCSDREACAERRARGGHYPTPQEAESGIEPSIIDSLYRSIERLPDPSVFGPPTTEEAQEPPTEAEEAPATVQEAPEGVQVGPETVEEPPIEVQSPPEEPEPTPEYPRPPDGPAKERAQSANPDLDPYVCHRCGRQGRRGFEGDQEEPGAPPVCRNREQCDRRRTSELRKANKGRCIDCVAEGITSERPAVLNDQGQPVAGNRCLTHQRALIKARKRAAHASRTLLKYRITGEQYWALYDALGGRCFVCRRATGKAKHLAVDHDHRLADGHDHPNDQGCEYCIRCLACGPCNVEVLGRLDVDGLLRAILVLTNPPAPALMQGLPYDTDGLVAAMRQALAPSWPEGQATPPLTQDQVDQAAEDLGVPAFTVEHEGERDEHGYLPGEREAEHRIENPELYHGDPLGSDDWSVVAGGMQPAEVASKTLDGLTWREMVPGPETQDGVADTQRQPAAVAPTPVDSWAQDAEDEFNEFNAALAAPPFDERDTVTRVPVYREHPGESGYHYVMDAQGVAHPTRHAPDGRVSSAHVEQVVDEEVTTWATLLERIGPPQGPRVVPVTGKFFMRDYQDPGEWVNEAFWRGPEDFWDASDGG